MSLMIEIKVVTQSGKSQLIIDKSGMLKCFVKSAPEMGKANNEIISIIAKACNVIKGNIEIVSGYTGRKKLIKIQTDMTYQELLEKLGSGIQKKII